jgi:hypothetical protein
MKITLPPTYDAARIVLAKALVDCVRCTVDRVVEADCAQGSAAWVALESVVPKSRIEPTKTGFRYRHQRASYGHWLRFRRPSKGAFDSFVWILHRNRKDLLFRALESVADSPSVQNVIIVDFSGELAGKDIDIEHSLFRVTRPKVSVTMMRNWLRELAIEHGVKFSVQLHSDAKTDHDLTASLVAEATKRQQWGWIHCPSEAFAAYNTQALLDVGAFDESLPFRGALEDYARRMKLRNWELCALPADASQFEHEGAATIKADAQLRLETETSLSWVRAHYEHKWGGQPGKEKHTNPYNVK